MTKSIGDRERRIIRLYCQLQLAMTPEQFYSKWDVTYPIIAEICWRSNSTVHGWFRQGKYQRYPTANDMRHLAIMDFLLENFEQLPTELLQLLGQTEL
jgi:hypothetical protein